MRLTRPTLLLTAALALAACGTSESTSPARLASGQDAIDIVPDYAASATAILDRSGIGGAQLPDSLALTTEQKAKLQAVHDAFERDNAADITALKAIEAEAKAARAAGQTREQVRTILQRAIPIRQRLDAAFRTLRVNIMAIYTPAQRAWIAAQQARACTPGSAPRLTEAQLQQMRALRDAFEIDNRADIQLIRRVGEELKAARAAGRSDAEIKAILAKAEQARQRLRAAERKLQEDVMAVLTADQRANWCVGRDMRGPGGAIGNS